MLRPKRPSDFTQRLKGTLFLACFLFTSSALLWTQTSSSSYSKRESGLYRDIFDQGLYYEGTQYFHLERLYRDLFGKKKRSLDVNAYDEVPDSTFFTNRHGKERLSLDALRKGPGVTEGPDSQGEWSITKGKFEGVTPGFFIRDGKGDKYLLKFDPMDNLDLATGAEVVTSRFFHALGYNVPQYTLASFKKDQLVIGPGAKVYEDTGFQKKLTPEKLDEFLLFLPESKNGLYRASASLILKGEILGPMSFQGRRRKDPEDLINHKDRREIRALLVFASWLNNYDTRESNSLDMYETKDGKSEIRHYLIDFNSTLGARPTGPKPPMFGHEHIVDYGEISKAVLSFGLWKKPWQKRWEEAGEKVDSPPSVGYFDNRHFDPGRYKTQLPYYPFKDLTRADGFWAAKLVMRFTDEEIRALVSTGDYSDPKARDQIAATLIERRDLIGRYWFREANPLDDFQWVESGGSHELHFEDLAVSYGFTPEGKSTYRFDVIGKKGKKGIHLAQEEVPTRSFSVRSEWLSQHPALDLLIRTRRQGEKSWSPFVRVEIRSEGGKPRIAGIFHQD